MSKSDRLDAPAWNWRSGDSFVQLHHLRVPANLEPGSYRLALGIYSRPGSPRLRVHSATSAEDDHVLLPQVEVRAE